MRFFIMVCLSLMVATQTLARDKSDTQAFKEAYQAYQESMKDNSKTRATQAAQTAYKLGKDIFGPSHKNTAALAQNYGKLLRSEKAQGLLTEALGIFEKTYGEDSFDLVDILMDLAASHAAYSHLGKAKRHYARALKIIEKHDSPDGMYAGIVNMEIGQVALAQSKSRDAIRYLNKAQKIFAANEGASAEVNLAKTRFWIGKYRLATKKYSTATKELNSSLATLTKYAPNSSMALSTHAFLIAAYEKQGMRDKATKHCLAIGAAKPHDPNQDYKPVYKIHPNYPESARRSSKEGYSIVSLTIDAEGFVTNPKVVENGGSKTFDAAALKAASQFRYAPRFVDGMPVATEDVRYKFTFDIR